MGRLTRLERSAVIASLLAASAALSSSAWAGDACDPAGRPWIELIIAPAGIPVQPSRILERLRAELEPRSIEVCLPTPATGPERASAPVPAASPIATVEVSPSSTSTVEVVVLVRDAVTNKRVARDVDLSRIPTDGHPLTIALAADELLRASWAELALSTASPPAQPVPGAVEETLASTLRQSRRGTPKAALGLALAFERYGGGQTLLGANVEAAVALTDRLAAFLELGLREGLPVRAPHGKVQSSTMEAALGTTFSLTPPAWRYGLDLRAELALLRLIFTGIPNYKGVSESGAAKAIAVRAGPVGWVSLGPTLRLMAGFTLGGVVHDAKANDQGTDVTAVSGVVGGARLGLVGTFR